MKIKCGCGELIVDQSDGLPHKAHMIPDGDWFATYDAIDDEVIDPVADGRVGKEAAYVFARQIINRSARLMWQCRHCGRLYIDGLRGELHCYLPADERTSHTILGGPDTASTGEPA